jgi:hypothetical protein
MELWDGPVGREEASLQRQQIMKAGAEVVGIG